MFWDTLQTDVRHTLRLALKTPGFSALTVLTLALGIGATSAIFAVVNGVLFRPLPYRETDRLVSVWSNATKENRPRNPLSPADFLDRQTNTTLEDLAGYYTFVDQEWLQTDAGSEALFSITVTPNLFPLLGRAPVLGRPFTEQDGADVAVLSDGFWKEDVTKGEVVRYSLNTKCDGNWVVVAKTNGQPEKLSWPKNIGDCLLELACRDASLNVIGNSRVTLAKNSTVKSYQSGAGVVDIVFGCAVGSFDAKCILELDR